MSRYRTMIVLMLLALWGTATVHCGLELDGLFGVKAGLAAKAAGAHDPIGQDNDPEGGGAIENGHFESMLSWFTISIPVEQISELPRESIAAEPAAVASRLPDASLLPMELNPCWVFHRRAAALSRAPAVLS